MHLSVTPDPRFERQGDNLHTTLTVGRGPGRPRHRGRRRVARRAPAPDGRAGHPARPRRAGPRPRACRTCAAAAAGDLFVHVLVETPGDLTPEQDELLRQFAALRGEGVSPPGAGGRRGCLLPHPLRLWLAPPSPPTPPSRCGPPRRRRSSCDDPAHPILAEEDVHHLGRVLRLRAGEEVIAADGLGRWARTVWRGEPDLEPLSAGTGVGGDGAVQFEPRGRAVPHGGLRARQGGAPRMGGAEADRAGHRPHRAAAQRAQRGALDRRRAGKATVERLRRVAREAAAQCRRVWLPEVSDTVSFADLGDLGGPGRGRAGPAERRPADRVPARGGRGPRGWLERRASWPPGCPPWGSASACCEPRRPPSPRARSWPPCVRAPWPRWTDHRGPARHGGDDGDGPAWSRGAPAAGKFGHVIGPEEKDGEPRA